MIQKIIILGIVLIGLMAGIVSAEENISYYDASKISDAYLQEMKFTSNSSWITDSLDYRYYQFSAFELRKQTQLLEKQNELIAEQNAMLKNLTSRPLVCQGNVYAGAFISTIVCSFEGV